MPLLKTENISFYWFAYFWVQWRGRSSVGSMREKEGGNGKLQRIDSRWWWFGSTAVAHAATHPPLLGLLHLCVRPRPWWTLPSLTNIIEFLILIRIVQADYQVWLNIWDYNPVSVLARLRPAVQNDPSLFVDFKIRVRFIPTRAGPTNRIDPYRPAWSQTARPGNL